MSPEVISRKLAKIRQVVGALQAAKDVTWKVFQEDIRARAFVERYLHMAVEGVLDIANHVISENRWREPMSYRDIFNVLSEHKVIPEEDLARFQNMVSFRNLLVNAYEKVDPEIIFGIFKGRLEDFDLFEKHVLRWLHQSGSKR